LLEGDILDARQGKKGVVVLVFDLAGIPVQHMEVGNVLDARLGKSDIVTISFDSTQMAELDVEVGDCEAALRRALGGAGWLNKGG